MHYYGAWEQEKSNLWLNAQHAWDLWDSERRFRNELAKIQPLNAA